MKKIAVILVSLVLTLCFSLGVCANVVTTSPSESTEASTAPEGYEDGLVREVDITAPITACAVIVCAAIVYGIAKLRKAKKDDVDM